MPFDEEEKETQVPNTKGLSNNFSKKSIVNEIQNSKRGNQKEFENIVNEHVKNQDENSKTMHDLNTKFQRLMSDKTLRENKNQLNNSYEAEVLKDIIEFGNKINNDVNEAESYGSIILITLLLKNSILMRDKINNLEFQISQIHEKINKDVER